MGKNMIDPKELGETVVKVLKTIYDPEIPVDIYELGLIYDVFLNEDNDFFIKEYEMLDPNTIENANYINQEKENNNLNIIFIR